MFAPDEKWFDDSRLQCARCLDVAPREMFGFSRRSGSQRLKRLAFHHCGKAEGVP
jgi:polyferredoxin